MSAANGALTSSGKRTRPVREMVSRVLAQEYMFALLILVGIFVVYVIAGTNVLSTPILSSLLVNGAPFVLAATGLTLVILVGGYDLSVAAVAVLANCILVTRSGTTFESNLLAMLIVFGAAGVVGALNGFLIAFLNVQSIAATLGTYIMATGIALVILPTPGGVAPAWVAPGLSENLGGVVPVPLIVIILCIGAWLVLRRSRFGHHIYAVGGDERAAMQSGVRVAWVKFGAYFAAAMFYAAAGVMLTAETASGDPTGGTLFLVLAFAAVALGGARFGGGRGTAIGSILGALILTVLQKTLFALGVSTFYTGIVQGLVLIAAVLVGQGSARVVTRSEEVLDADLQAASELTGGDADSEPPIGG